MSVISLTLEGDTEIGLQEIAADEQPVQPLYHIQQIKPYKQEFSLLQGMDVFVISFDGGQWSFGENNTKEVDGQHTTSEWDDLVANDDQGGWWELIFQRSKASVDWISGS